MRIAVCPGSFDPVTMGHLDIIKRASKLFDKVIIAVSVNSEKAGSFSLEERMRLIEKSVSDLDNVTVEVVYGLLASYVKEVGACAIVKGLRAVSDFEYEFQMALANKMLCPEAETVFLTTASENMYLSSSLVKQIAGYGGDIDGLVPPQVQNEVLERLKNKLVK